MANNNLFVNESAKNEDENPSCTYWERFSFAVSQRLSQFFYALGFRVALNPLKTIFLTFLILGMTSLGYLNFHYEQNALNTFVQADSELSINTKWLLNATGEVIREEVIVLQAENVLTPEILKQVAYITNIVMNLSVSNSENKENTAWDDLCIKIPNIFFYTQEDDEEYTTENTTAEHHPFEAIVDIDTETFCDSYLGLDQVCLQENILALWDLDAATIDQLTVEDILKAINKTKISPLTGLVTDFVHLLGGVKRNANGYIISAETIMINFMVNNSLSEGSSDGKFNIFANKELVSDKIRAWEGAFNAKMKELQSQMLSGHNITLHYSASRSFSDVSDDLWADSLVRLAFGFLIMFIYLQFVLLKYDCLEIRLFVGISGLVSVGMAMISGFGISCAAGYVMSNTQLSIPFIIIGLGVDDMFVIMSSLDKMRKKHKNLPLPQIIAITMQHSGTAITITSLTNIVVFLVGMKTTIPALNSYYFTAAPCIFMTYFFVVTFFVAVVTLDEQRIAAGRNFLVPCFIHKVVTEDHEIVEKEQPSWFVQGLEYVYSNLIFTKLGKVIVMIPVVFLTINCLLQIPKVKRTFTLSSVMSRDSFHYKFLAQKSKFYPNLGYESYAMMGNLNYSKDLPKIFELSDKIFNQTDILYDVKSWLNPFQNFVLTYYHKDVRKTELTDSEWKFYLSQFLFSSDGGQYNFNFKFEKKLECGQPVSNVKISTIDFKFKPFCERDEYMPAKYRIDKIIEDAHLESGEGYSSIWSHIFFYWIPNSIIDSEILRNLLLGWLSVTICTSILIANIQMCFWIQCCVLLTMINVVGFMERWDLPYDYLTCVALQMAVGLCVDYAVHIGHTFMTVSSKDKTERALRSVVDIGPAVFHGGVSTLLMFATIGTVDSYSSQVFVKVFVLVIVFGLYNGLVFLPVVLSLIGPDPYTRIKDPSLNEKKEPTTDVYTINSSTNQLNNSFTVSNETIDIRL